MLFTNFIPLLNLNKIILHESTIMKKTTFISSNRYIKKKILKEKSWNTVIPKIHKPQRFKGLRPSPPLPWLRAKSREKIIGEKKNGESNWFGQIFGWEYFSAWKKMAIWWGIFIGRMWSANYFIPSPILISFYTKFHCPFARPNIWALNTHTEIHTHGAGQGDSGKGQNYPFFHPFPFLSASGCVCVWRHNYAQFEFDQFRI